MPGSTAQADSSTIGKTAIANRKRCAREPARFPVSISVVQTPYIDASFSTHCDA
ncbi:hypothetical protein [Burkholderia cepacia]|uniref:hypothetical protein n=1 Tax=Burkholderia cepacia TaxID=292 RepID=UPI0018C66A8B|nr:hypothetical protein [Burkholderia cepacia]